MKIEIIVVSPFQQNARILMCEKTGSGIVIDPGDDAQKIYRRIQTLKIKIEYILATHGHIDHIGGVADLQKLLNVPFFMHQEDTIFLQGIEQYAGRFGMNHVQAPTVSRCIQDNEILKFGEIEGKALHTPGHSQGSLSYLFGDDIFVGDVLFDGAVGRTDLMGGSFPTLEKSIRSRLYILPSYTRVHSGHGRMTTIGAEKESNPFVRE